MFTYFHIQCYDLDKHMRSKGETLRVGLISVNWCHSSIFLEELQCSSHTITYWKYKARIQLTSCLEETCVLPRENFLKI